MPEPTVSEILNIDNPEIPKKHSVLSITAWLLFFPPVGIYYAWKDKSLHWLMAVITLIFGIIDVLTISAVLTIPTFKAVMKTVNGSFNEAGFIFQIILIVILGLMQIIHGFIAYKKAKKDSFLTNNWLTFLVISLVLTLVLQAILAITMFTYTISPYLQTLYSL